MEQSGSSVEEALVQHPGVHKPGFSMLKTRLSDDKSIKFDSNKIIPSFPSCKTQFLFYGRSSVIYAHP